MNESYNATLTLWPATPLPASVARELQELGVNLTTFTVNNGWFAASRNGDATLVLDLSFSSRRCGLSDLEGVLATLRLARISYVAWDVKDGELAGMGRSYDPATGIERQFTVMADGEPVLSASDLEEFASRYGTAEELIAAIRSWLCLPISDSLTQLTVEDLAIVTLPDDDAQDESLEILGNMDGAPDACPRPSDEGRR
jgi:hypothetical protein